MSSSIKQRGDQQNSNKEENPPQKKKKKYKRCTNKLTHLIYKYEVMVLEVSYVQVQF